jgi:hypothetical protein
MRLKLYENLFWKTKLKWDEVLKEKTYYGILFLQSSFTGGETEIQ